MGIFIKVYFIQIQKYWLKNKQVSVWEYVAPNLHERPTKGAMDFQSSNLMMDKEMCDHEGNPTNYYKM